MDSEDSSMSEPVVEESSPNTSGESNVEQTRLKKMLICIEYPGCVKNDDNAIETLGGKKAMSEVLCSENRRLELKFSPKNIFVKSSFGDRRPTAGILIRVRRKKNGEGSCETKIMGLVSARYTFNSICDFQYLPVAKLPGKESAQNLYYDLVPSGVLPLSWLNEGKDIPYFIIPSSFSRMDSVHDDIFKNDKLSLNEDTTNLTVGKTRIRHNVNAYYIAFNLVDPLPTTPRSSSCEFLKGLPGTSDLPKLIAELFERRPIWSKTALQYEIGYQSNLLKRILPTIAYFYTTGPWRLMWVRFGFDPRKDFASRYYQLITFRIRSLLSASDFLKVKSHSYSHVPKSVRSRPLRSGPFGSQDKDKEEKVCVKPFFEINELPQAKQIMYQYCEIRVPQIQEMLDKIPTPLSGRQCHEKHGWLPSGFDDTCREIMLGVVKTQIQARKDQFTEMEEADDMSDDDELDEDEEEMLEGGIDEDET